MTETLKEAKPSIAAINAAYESWCEGSGEYDSTYINIAYDIDVAPLVAERDALKARVTEVEKERDRLHDGISAIVNCQSALTRSQVREACADVLKGNTTRMRDQSPFISALAASRLRVAELEKERDDIDKEVISVARREASTVQELDKALSSLAASRRQVEALKEALHDLCRPRDDEAWSRDMQLGAAIAEERIRVALDAPQPDARDTAQSFVLSEADTIELERAILADATGFEDMPDARDAVIAEAVGLLSQFAESLILSSDDDDGRVSIATYGSVPDASAFVERHGARQMTGLYSQMTNEQRTAALAHDGPGNIGVVLEPSQIVSDALELPIEKTKIRGPMVDALENRKEAGLPFDPEERLHSSDCAIHNEPALPAGPCDCGAIFDVTSEMLKAGVDTASLDFPTYEKALIAIYRAMRAKEAKR